MFFFGIHGFTQTAEVFEPGLISDGGVFGLAISPDEDYILYFSSDSTGYGEVDIYISFKKNSKWSSPKNLGAKVNSALAEFCPFYHEKEKRLYFSRQKKGEGRMYEDLYFIPFNPYEYK